MTTGDKVYYQDANISSKSVRYVLTGPIITAVGYFKLPVAVDVAPSGVEISGNTPCAFLFDISYFGGGSLTSLDYLKKANNLSDVQSVSTSRTNLGLGTAAVVNTGTGASDVPTIAQADARYAPIPVLSFLAYTGGNQSTTVQTFADIHSSAAWTIASAGAYEFDATISYTSAAATTGCAFTLNGPAQNYIKTEVLIDTALTDRSAFVQFSYNFGPVFVLSTRNPSPTTSYASISAKINFTATGTLVIRFASEIGGSAIIVTNVTGYMKKIN
jgi:hypothetical protein